MNGYDVVCLTAKMAKQSLTSIEKAIGVGKNNISTCRGKGSNPRSDRLAAMLSCCGYKLVAVPKDTKLSDDSFVID